MSDPLRSEGMLRTCSEPAAVGGCGAADNSLVVFFNRRPTDDEFVAVLSLLKLRMRGDCPFCNRPSYVIPCCHCGEGGPDGEF